VPAVTCRAVHAEQETITTTMVGCRLDPKRGVLPVGDQPQFRISQRVCAEGPHGQVPQAGNLLAV
jgi:hypothetical protein